MPIDLVIDEREGSTKVDDELSGSSSGNLNEQVRATSAAVGEYNVPARVWKFNEQKLKW